MYTLLCVVAVLISMLSELSEVSQGFTYHHLVTYSFTNIEFVAYHLSGICDLHNALHHSLQQ